MIKKTAYILLILNLFSWNIVSAQSILIKNQNGKKINEIKKGTEVRIKLYDKNFLTVHDNYTDSVVHYTFDGEQHMDKIPLDLYLMKDSSFTNQYFNGVVDDIDDNRIYFSHITAFDYNTRDLRTDDRYYYFYKDVYFSYKMFDGVPIENIHQLHIPNQKLDIFSTVTNIVGITCVVFSPVISYNSTDDSFDWTRMAIVGGIGVGIYFGGKIAFNFLENNRGYYTTKEDDLNNISDKYKWVELE